MLSGITSSLKLIKLNLQVDYSGFMTINPQRFGQKYVGKVVSFYHSSSIGVLMLILLGVCFLLLIGHPYFRLQTRKTSLYFQRHQNWRRV